jgi:hypothetical protein
MLTFRIADYARRSLCVLVVLSASGAAPVAAQLLDRRADALLAIDQHRASVVEHIVTMWDGALAKANATVSIDELRTRLATLRADTLLAASLAGTLDGLLEVIGADDISRGTPKPRSTQVKTFGDTLADAVYTPVTPCRLVDTRGTFAAVYQGNGSAAHNPVPFASNEIRTYTLQGGNGVCLTQLPAGLNASAVQLQVFGMPTTSASGDVEILPQGASFGSTATMVYVATIPFNTVSTAAKVNFLNHQISVQVRGGGAHVAIDVVGYFESPAEQFAMDIDVGGGRVMRYEYGQYSPNIIGGDPGNGIAGTSGAGGVTIGGGGRSDALCFNPANGSTDRPCVNQAQLAFGTIAGGFSNVTSGYAGTVGGGSANTAGGQQYAAVGGGYANTASGHYAVVPGGALNVASATVSFAAGYRAKATTTGSFIWADSRDFDFQPSVNNFFGVRATGGIGLTVAIDPNTGGVTQFCNLLPGTPSWQCVSDRNAKENFLPVDGVDILRRVVAMPVSTWNMKGSDPAIRSLGPVAQDFHAAFGLGNDDRTIAVSNVAGVSLAAIQGLYKIVQEKDAKLEAQEREISALHDRLTTVETMRDEVRELKAVLAAFQRSQILGAR